MGEERKPLEPAYLVMYGPVVEHAPAFIVGNRAALKDLRGALDAVLDEGQESEGLLVFGPDGEGHDLYVVERSDVELLPVNYPLSEPDERHDAYKRVASLKADAMIKHTETLSGEEL